MKRAGWVIVLLIHAVSGAAAVRIKGTVSADALSVAGYLTNTISITITPESGEPFFTNRFYCHYPADPVHKGLETVASRYAERLIYRDRTTLKERRIVLTYVFTPKYAGSVVLKPRSVHLVHKGITNTVMTPVHSVTVIGASTFPFLVVVVLLVTVFAVFFILYKRRKPVSSPENSSDPDTSGGSDVE